jgi:hypothetical protein
LTGLLPFIPYGIGRISGALPSEAAWFAGGANHGPWWGQNVELLIPLSMLFLLVALPPTTLAVMALFYPKRRRMIWAFLSSSLCGLQWALARLQIVAVFWTVD